GQQGFLTMRAALARASQVDALAALATTPHLRQRVRSSQRSARYCSGSCSMPVGLSVPRAWVGGGGGAASAPAARARALVAFPARLLVEGRLRVDDASTGRRRGGARGLRSGLER